MAYNLVTTDEMDSLLDNCVYYLLNKLKSEQAAKHLLTGVDKIYDELEDNPYLYRESQDPFMNALHYREAKVPEMDYVIVYKIVESDVYILGIFNTRENYSDKMKIIWNFFWDK